MTELGALQRDLGRIEGKLDLVISRVTAQIADHEVRISRVEDRDMERRGAVKLARWLWGIVSTLIGLVAGYFGGSLHG